MRGTIYLHNAAGRALRKRAAAVHLRDVVHGMGEFAAGDAIHVGFRGSDGGQFVVARGIATCAATRIAQWLAGPRTGAGADEVVVREADLRLLWPVGS